MQERCGGKFSIDNHILRKTLSQAAYHPPQQALAGGVLAVTGSVRFPIARQRQAGSHHANHHQRMLVALNLFLGIPPWAAERTALLGPPSRTGAVDGQTDPAAIVEGLVALGATDEGEQGLPRGVGIEPLSEIAQGIVTERSGDSESAPCRRSYQRLDGMKSRLAEEFAVQQVPQQSPH